MVKAILCDIDGTLLNSDFKVSEATLASIKKVKDKGIIFGLATGREAKAVEILLEEWGIDGLVDFIVGNGGSEIYDLNHDIKKSQYPLDGDLILEIMSHYEDMDINFAIPEDGKIYAYKDNEMMRMLSKVDQLPFEVVDYNEFCKQPHSKLMIVCEEELMDAVIERSHTFQNENFKTASLKTASVLYEFMDPRISKTLGIKEALENYGITLEQTCVFGDADNDHDMIVAAGIGVAMANGSAKTKAAADHITDDNDHDGIASYIDNYIL